MSETNKYVEGRLPSLTYHGITDIDRLHTIALMNEKVPIGSGKTFYHCHLVAGLIMLSNTDKAMHGSIIAVMCRNTRDIQRIQRTLNSIFEEYSISKIEFGVRETYGSGLFSTDNAMMIKFCIDDKDLLGFKNYYLVDTRG